MHAGRQMPIDAQAEAGEWSDGLPKNTEHTQYMVNPNQPLSANGRLTDPPFQFQAR
jgi:hypothetical protein